MTHSASHIIIEFAQTVLSLEDRLEGLSDEQREKVLEVAERANEALLRDLRRTLGD